MFNSRLTGCVVPVSGLTDSDTSRMFDLMTQNYEGVKIENFRKDLSEKLDVIVLRDKEEQQIQGFSTLMILEETVDGRKAKALFSGDTIIDKSYWGDSELESHWGKYAFSLIDKNPGIPLFWFLMSKGYKTYRFLPVFFKEFYPRYDQPTPNYEQEVLDTFATKKFQLHYNRQTGLIIFNGSKDKLKQGIADIEEPRLKNPHIRYFAQRNPKWTQGDELACIIPLTKDNFNSMGRRMVEKDIN